MKLSIITCLIVACFVSVALPANAAKRQLQCQTVYVLGGTVTTCR